MKLSLFNRLVLAFVVTFSLLIMLFYHWSAYLESSVRLESEQSLHLNLAKHLAADNPLLQDEKFAYQDLSNLFHTLMMLGPNFEFYFVDPKGKILAFSADPGKVKSEFVNLTPITDMIAQQKPLPILGDDPRQPLQQKIFSAAPVYKNEQLTGYLYVIIGSEKAANLIASLKANKLRWQHFLILATILLFVAISMLWVFYLVTKPVKRLAKALSNIDPTQIEMAALAPWLSHSHHEVNQLGHSFAKLLQQNQALLVENRQQLQQLAQIDQQRREMLAGLSHDLRTPLASLQGYVEVLSQSSSSLSSPQQQQYLGIIDRNSQQLKDLIDQVFELAYLEGGQVQVQQEPLLLCEYLHDIKAKMQLNAERAGVQLHLQHQGDDILVTTDVAKLERILTNLIENAIRHTPQGGDVFLQVRKINEQGNQLHSSIALSIADTGVGISPDQLPYIFNARYRGASAKQGEPYRAGLGLTVCQKLAHLLGSDIQVSSAPGQGSRFMLQLPTAPLTC
ncbi:sensor histidine kinase [Motilimonas pumila]|uniref:histidine kinase n=1 Tax=Motilimonas pumila TaxID=2303987 RepID=A0A418YDJ6_9GAMM|nr:HAMP domain-containing sensor histidine kinase [Motilimonas pumila]RJG42605.1 sensor histidine kinase [Motilimonas pumila]